MTKPKPRRTKAQWAKLVQDKSDSNLTIEQYCKQHQVTVASFYAWRAKLKKQSANDNANIAALPNDDWLPIKLSSPTPSASVWDIELDLPRGVTLRMKSS